MEKSLTASSGAIAHRRPACAARKRDIGLDQQATLASGKRTVVEHDGSANKSVALQLFISEHTLHNHLSPVCQELCVTSWLELYMYAVEHQLCLPAASEPRPASCAGR